MLNLAGFADDSITDGPGLRFVVFAQGCPHRCEGCHNPQTHEFGVGKAYTTQDIYQKIKANPLITKVTFSGGEPFCQANELAELGERLQKEGYELAAYTGYTFAQLQEMQDPGVHRLLACLNTMVDGPFVLSLKSYELRFRGSSNQRILDVQASLRAGQAVMDTSGRWTDAY